MSEADAYFEQVYAQSWRRVLRYIVTKTNACTDVEDLMQEVYRKFYIRLQKRGGQDLKEPEAYLMTLAKRELSAHYRGRKAAAQPDELPEDAADPGPPVEEAVLQRLDTAAVWRVAQQEPLLSYKAFILFYGFDLPIAQIAKELTLSEQAVKSRLCRTRARVRAALEKGAIR